MSDRRNEFDDITISIDGRDYQFRRDFKSVCLIEQTLGKGILEVAASIVSGSFGLHDLAVIIHFGAVAAGEKVTLNEIGEAINREGINNVTPQLGPYMKAIFTGSPKDNGSEK